MDIKNVIICGLGAIGLTYADKLNDVCNLRILADKTRIDRYLKDTPKVNGKELKLNYITPDDSGIADLIIISTKFNGLDDAIKYIKNFVGENTIIISLLNGLASEEKIAKVYGKDKILHSYFIGTKSSVRVGNSVVQDGKPVIVFGTPYKENKEKENNLKKFFDKNKIDYKIPDNIIYSLWAKFATNVVINQLSAILNLTFGQTKNDYFRSLELNILDEVTNVAKAENVDGYQNIKNDVMAILDKMTGDSKTSMLQDIIAGRKTEVDIFAGDVIRMGKRHGIDTPCNQMLYNMIRVMEEVKR